MNYQKIYMIYRLLIILLFSYLFVASIISFSGYDPVMGSLATNYERYNGGILIGAIPGLPLSALYIIPFAKILKSNPEIWVLALYNIFNMILGYYTWVKFPDYLYTKIKKLKNSKLSKR